jgi:hypothetical protein
MVSRSAEPTDVPAPAAERRGSALSVLAFAARCHAGQRRASDGAPFIEHLSEVARLLRDAGCPDVVVAAGLLHSVVEDTDVSAAELTARFGASVTELVEATTNDCVGNYAMRRIALREQIRAAGSEAAMLFAAIEISEVRALARHVRRERARVGPAAPTDGARERVERLQQMRFEEHRASLAMLSGVASEHRLVKQLASEIADCPVTIRRPRRAGAPA